ncbi:MAG: M23 family metallopeptidase [Bacteroidales bacterium]|nr:M23 family metallopeptidase [Bacteroidales bacterium]
MKESFYIRHPKLARAHHLVLTALKTVLRLFLVSASLAVVYYLIFSMVIDTDTEEQLKKENETFRQTYSEMLRKEQLISDVVDGLALKDDKIYRQLFSSPVPSSGGDGMDEVLSAVLSPGDSILEKRMVDQVSRKLSSLESSASRIEDNFSAVFAAIESGGVSLPPLSSPVGNFSYAGAGASVGQKINPFYKVKVEHGGFDMVTSTGVAVSSAAAGTVTSVTRSGKGLGNVVEVTHPGGWRTRYAHLDQISVASGQKVSCGQKLGTAGMSGNSFAPHLHYEVLRDSLRFDPVHFFFASATPEEYMTMLFMSANAGQSMD